MEYTLETPSVAHGEPPMLSPESNMLGSTSHCTEENVVFVELIPSDSLPTTPPVQNGTKDVLSRGVSSAITTGPTCIQVSKLSTHGLLYRIVKPPVNLNQSDILGESEQTMSNIEIVENDESAASPCPSVTAEATVCSDSSCSDTGNPTEKCVHVRPYFKSRAIQKRPQIRSCAVQAGRPLRKRKLVASYDPPLRKPNSAMRKLDGSLLQVKFSYFTSLFDSLPFPPVYLLPSFISLKKLDCIHRQHSSRYSLHTWSSTFTESSRRSVQARKRIARTTAVRKKRTPDSDQCLEDIYDGLPASRKSEIIPLCGYDRVSSICRDTFENKEDWLQDGFPKCFEICALIAQPVRLVIWLARRRLIRNRTACPQCPNPMLLRTAMVDRHIYKWACRRCGRKLSIRHGSMFIKAGVSDPHIVLILYLWSVGYPTDFLGAEIETSLSSVRWYVWLALKSCAAQLRREFRPLHGVVELHWDSFLRPTDKREGLNLLCGVERNTGKVFAVRCPRGNDKALLRRLIQTNIAPGSSIMTRDMPAYTQLNLQNMGYMHYVLDREHEIALDDLVIDLSQVEDFVNTIKSFLRKQGGPGLFCKDIFLAEMIVRRTWGRNLLPMVLYSISQAYDVS
ncbi:hypothetical protein FGIG_03538 [Fasciola gigantica]|uniref:ISXO2-like transposase domain-containing protein n=1 Tax=Fasciola gigantica TaxID=46835 RepID=A0A504Z123_FASGI|nr:hypothetical protein FGIG_03538 [Fasciola gigantica]